MSDFSELQAADSYCRLLARRHYENFWVLSPVLPRDVRLHLTRIYGYCRTTDDIGDESGPFVMQRLQQWREQVLAALDGDFPIHPVLIALRETAKQCSIPNEPFLDLIEANLQYHAVTTYESWSELRAFCLLTAAPVGRMVLRVFGVDAPDAVPLSDDVCIGHQLTNFAQDVCIDAGKGRTYLLQSDLRTLGMADAVRVMCDRAARLLESGRALEDLLPRRLRVQLTLYRLGGEAIIDSIRRSGYRTDQHRPRVAALTKLRLFGTAVRSGYHPLIVREPMGRS
jgi:phytoene/squalene synthetase